MNNNLNIAQHLQPQQQSIQNQKTTITSSDLEKLKRDVETWLILSDDIKKLNDEKKKMQQQKKQLTPKLEEMMNIFDIELCKSSVGDVKMSKTFVKEPLNKEKFKENLGIFLRNVQQAEEAIKFANENRSKIPKTTIRKVAPKKNKQLPNIL
jgi:hypothetical protein